MRSRVVVTTATGAALITAAVLAGGGSAQAPGPRTLTFTEVQRGSTFKFVDNPPRSRGQTERTFTVSAGDLIALQVALRDAAGQRAGSIRASCVATRGGRTNSFFVCHGVAKLRDGDLALEVGTAFGASSTGAIVGGTGAYNGARGTFTSRETEGRPTVDTFQLLP